MSPKYSTEKQKLSKDKLAAIVKSRIEQAQWLQNDEALYVHTGSAAIMNEHVSGSAHSAKAVAARINCSADCSGR